MSSSWQIPAYVRRGDIQLNITAKGGAPPPPYEFGGVVTPEEYQYRMNAIILLLRKWAWSLGERLFLAIALFLTIVGLVGRMLVDQAKNANATATDEVLFQAEESALFKARAITTGVLVAIGLIFWGPYFFYKRVPSQHTRQRMPAEDPRQRSGGPSSQPLPSNAPPPTRFSSRSRRTRRTSTRRHTSLNTSRRPPNMLSRPERHPVPSPSTPSTMKLESVNGRTRRIKRGFQLSMWAWDCRV